MLKTDYSKYTVSNNWCTPYHNKVFIELGNMLLFKYGTYLAAPKCYLQFAFCYIQIGWMVVDLYLKMSETMFIILEQKISNFIRGLCDYKDGCGCGCGCVGA